MDFALPLDLVAYLGAIDAFIDAEIRPMQAADDNERFFDHRREHARTDWDNDGLPRPEWEALLAKAAAAADRAGFLRFALPAEFGGGDGGNFAMAVIREHLAAKGLGLHNDLQNEHSIVGNFGLVTVLRDYGSADQRRDFIDAVLNGERRLAFALTEPDHGSDATFMETMAVRETRDGSAGWRIDGEKMWTTAMHVASHVMLFARTSGRAGDATGITCFLVPAKAAGVEIAAYLWTFNMPTDHAQVRYTDVWVPDDAILGPLDDGLSVAQHLVHDSRIRQAASSLGAADYCVRQSVNYARARKPFGKPLAVHQAIQFPLVELATQVEMLRLLIRKTALEMDAMSRTEVAATLSDKVAMCNYQANRLVCEAADRAMQVHGGIGYSRHTPFEHIYRHHRRYRITEGAEEIQMRKIAAWMFGFAGPNRVQPNRVERNQGDQ